MKYLINTGCSYGVMFRSFKEFTKGNDTEFNVIDLHCDSHGAEYQQRSIISTISDLLSKGIPTSDIYVIVEWSQPNRLLIELPQENSKYILDDNDNSEGSFLLNNKFERLNDGDYIKKYKSLNVIMGDRVYINPDLNDFSEYDKENRNYLEAFKETSGLSYKSIDRLETYLTNILTLQSFLKSNGIEYTFFLMNNTFEGYSDDYSHVTSTSNKQTSKGLQQDTPILPMMDMLIHIEDFSTYLKNIWNLIDMDGFVFYKTNGITYGGIDEYAIERFGHIAYTSSANEWDIPDDGYITSFGAHPHDSVYIDFFKEYIYDRIKHFIGELNFNMTDRWSYTKHNAIRK